MSRIKMMKELYKVSLGYFYSKKEKKKEKKIFTMTFPHTIVVYFVQEPGSWFGFGLWTLRWSFMVSHTGSF